MSCRKLLAVAVLCLALSGCDDKKSDSDSKAESKGAAEAESKDGEGGKGDAKTKKKEKDDAEDKGNANLLLDDKEWAVERCSAKIKDGKLRISASRMERVDGKMSREALSLSIPDYKGAGEYTLNNANSNFSGVGVDTKAMEDAKDDKAQAEAAKKATAKALGGSSVALMMGAKVKIESDDGKYIDGTVEWSGVTGLRGPKKISGKFHARIRE